MSVGFFFDYKMEINSNQNCLITSLFQNIFFCVTQKKLYRFGMTWTYPLNVNINVLEKSSRYCAGDIVKSFQLNFKIPYLHIYLFFLLLIVSLCRGPYFAIITVFLFIILLVIHPFQTIMWFLNCVPHECSLPCLSVLSLLFAVWDV